jgi:DNA (cytosine-5)-methyltransferase 1
LKKTYNVVDMFCGAGGESTGIMQAALEMDMKVDLLAINHWERAMETHAANHPSAEHLCESVERIDPTRVVRNGKINLLWASPECTGFSIALGGRPRSDQKRTSPWLILKWLSELYVERVIIENVKEFRQWGPLDKNGKPIDELKGQTFYAFISAIQSLGYKVDWRILTCADYGDPTTRQRLFIQAVKGRKRILWPQITHVDGKAKGYKPWVPAKEIIDWSVPGESIFNRKKPLVENTIRRIAAGIERYWGDYAEPFLAVLYGTGNVRSLNLPLPSVTTSGTHHALVTPLLKPFITRYHGGKSRGENRNHEITRPLPTVDTSNRYALVSAEAKPFLLEYYGNGDSYSVEHPLKTVTTKDRFALIKPGDVCFDITFRMLRAHELKRGQGFNKDYIITGNDTEQKIQIGNAVPPGTAKALTLVAMSE